MNLQVINKSIDLQRSHCNQKLSIVGSQLVRNCSGCNVWNWSGLAVLPRTIGISVAFPATAVIELLWQKVIWPQNKSSVTFIDETSNRKINLEKQDKRMKCDEWNSQNTVMASVDDRTAAIWNLRIHERNKLAKQDERMKYGECNSQNTVMASIDDRTAAI